MVLNVNKKEYVNDTSSNRKMLNVSILSNVISHMHIFLLFFFFFFLSSVLFAWLQSGFPFVVREIIINKEMKT